MNALIKQISDTGDWRNIRSDLDDSQYNKKNITIIT